MAAKSYTAVLAGKYGVGKTSIFRRLMYDKYTEEEETTKTSAGNSGLEKYIYTTCVGDDAAPVEVCEGSSAAGNHGLICYWLGSE